MKLTAYLTNLAAGRRGVLLAMALTFSAGAILSSGAALKIRSDLHQAAQLQFADQTDRLTRELQQRINLAVYGLRGARAVFTATRPMAETAFAAYVASRDLPNEFPGVQSFGFVVPAAPAHPAHADAGSATDTAPQYLVKLEYPGPVNGIAPGADLARIPGFYRAINRAVYSGLPCLSPTLKDPLAETGTPSLACYFMPVYQNGLLPQTALDRRTQLLGLVFASIRIDQVLAHLTDATDGKIACEIFDGPAVSDSSTVRVAQSWAASSGNLPEISFDRRLFHEIKQVSIGGRTWSIRLSTLPAFEAAIDHRTPVAVAGLGAALTVALSAMVGLFGFGRQRTLLSMRLTRQMYEELLQTHDKLEVERERFDLALAGSQSGIWELNPVTDEAIFDTRTARIVGENHLPGRGLAWRDRMHPDDQPQALASLDRHLRGETDHYESVCRIHHSSGEWRWVMSRGLVVSRNTQGQPTRVIGLVGDITERRELEQQLAQNQRLESLGGLAAGIAHEINTPTQYVGDNMRFLQEQFGTLLQALDAYARNADEPSSDQASRQNASAAIRRKLDLDFVQHEIPQAITQSLEGIDRVTTVVLAMKDFSHPGSGNKEPADLNRAILATIEVCRNRWKSVARLQTNLAEDLPSVPCLVGEINQVLLHLIVNAADAISESGSAVPGLITVTSLLIDNGVQIEVSDNGPGIADACRHRIFEPFYTSKQVGKAAGQGLHLSRNIVVNRHGGKMSFQSTPGAGTRFVVQLPLLESRVELLEAA